MAVVSAQYVRAVEPIPVGSIQMYAGGTSPNTWLLCDGSSLSTSGYPELFSAIGYAYGGSGASFNVPDLRGRVPVGAGTGAQMGATGTGIISGGTALTTRNLGVFGGDERMQTHTHVQNAHTHVQNAHGHDLGPGQSFGTSFGGNAGGVATFGLSVAIINTNTYQGPYSANANTATNQNTTATNQNAGSGSSENMPPFVVTNYIIKARPDVSQLSSYFNNSGTVNIPTVSGFPATPAQGDQVYNVATGQPILYRYNGSSWQPVSLPSGSIVQTVIVRSDTRFTYSSATSGNGTTVSALNLTITPRFSTSQIICDWMINGELHQDNVFLVHKDGALASNGYNLTSGNNRWAGLMAGFYDQNEDSTPSNWNLKYVDSSLVNTNARTYAPAVRSSGGSNLTLALNGTINAAAQDAYERMVSIGVAYEVIA